MGYGKTPVVVTAMAVALTGLAACSAADPDPWLDDAVGSPTTPIGDPTVFARASGPVEAFRYGLPLDMARERSVVVAGTVVGFTDGYEVVERRSAEHYADTHDYSVVMKVQVWRVYKGELHDADFLYVNAPRGGGEPPTDIFDTPTPVRAFTKAIPVGTEVVVMADRPLLPHRPSVEVIGLRRGVPAGATVVSGAHPQSLSFALPGGGTTSWADLSLEDIRADLNGLY